MNQPNDQWVIGVAPVKIRMNGLMTRRTVKENGTRLQLVVESASCMSGHSHNHSRDDERTALASSQRGEAFEEEEENKWVMVMVDDEGSALIYGVAKMSKQGADLSWGLGVLNLELKLFPEILILKVDC